MAGLDPAINFVPLNRKFDGQRKAAHGVRYREV
jgi:hypothetical protein